MRVRLQNRQKRRKLLGPAQYRGEDAVYVLLADILEEERKIEAYMGKKKPPPMTPKHLQKHICKESLVKDVVWDNFSVHHPDSGRFAAKATEDAFMKPSEKLQSRDRKEKQKNKHKIDQWIAKTKETCLFCAEPLLIKKTQGLSEGAMPHHRTDGRAAVGGCLQKLQPERFAWINKGWILRIILARRD